MGFNLIINGFIILSYMFWWFADWWVQQSPNTPSRPIHTANWSSEWYYLLAEAQAMMNLIVIMKWCNYQNLKMQYMAIFVTRNCTLTYHSIRFTSWNEHIHEKYKITGHTLTLHWWHLDIHPTGLWSFYHQDHAFDY